MEHVIELKNVTKTFKDFSIKDIDLQVKQGFVTGFIGANGAGKSTVLKIMMNLLKPDAGKLRCLGTTIKRMKRRSKTGLDSFMMRMFFLKG